MSSTLHCNAGKYAGTKYVLKTNMDKTVGAVHTIFKGIKATCQLHRNCTCFINVPAGMHHSAVMVDLLRWLDEAARPGCSSVDHFTSSLQLRRDKYKMKVK